MFLIVDDEKHGGKMIFKKPDKQAKSGSEKIKKSKMKQVKNSTLLSFGDEEEED